MPRDAIQSGRHAADPPRVGKVFLVGAGPGDPQLMTLRAVACLGQADAVLYDYLVNPAALEHAAPTADRICLGAHGRMRIWSQEEINDRLVQLARQGLRVVRLKGGDPAVFARGAEEIEHLHAHGIPFEVVPGITAALAAGSYAGIPITHRRLASAAALVTGQQRGDQLHSDVDFEALARFPGTLVIYMGVTTAGLWTDALIRAGKDPDTPTAIIRRCSLPDQQTIRCPLKEVPQVLAPANRVRPPVIVIVGDVAQLPDEYDWFTHRPLFGKTVLVTRPETQADSLAQGLQEHGANVLLQPAIQIVAPDSWAAVDQAVQQLGQYDWLVFSSSNGVRFFLGRMFEMGLDTRPLGSARIAVVGPGTAQTLWEYHLRADVQPDTSYRAEDLAAALLPASAGQRCLLLRTDRGRDVLGNQLRDGGTEVDELVVYRSLDVMEPQPDHAAALEEGKIDWITVTSSAIARSLSAMFGPALGNAHLASISPLTTATLQELGQVVRAEASEATMEGLIEAIVQSQPLDSGRRSV